MNSAFLLDLLLAALLLITIGCGLVLNRRIGRLRAYKTELETLMQNFSGATEQALAGVEGLKRAADDGGQSLQPLIDEARSLADDLKFLNERGEGLANLLQAETAPRRHRHVSDNPTGSRSDVAEAETRQAAATGMERGSSDSANDGLIEALERMR